MKNLIIGALCTISICLNTTSDKQSDKLSYLYDNEISFNLEENDNDIYGNDVASRTFGDIKTITRNESYSANSVKDEYEYNDTVSSAKLISPKYDGSKAPVNYSVELDATLHRNEALWGLVKKDVDIDFYQFRIYGKADVTISLSNIPSECNYDLELFEHCNIRYAGEESVSSVGLSNNNSNINEKICLRLLPGVFYIKVFSCDGSFNASQKYNLVLNVEYDAKNEYISDLRFDKGVGAAIWVSDYDPFGIKPFSSQGISEVGVFASSEYYNAYNFGNPMFQYVKGGEKVLHASLYIWDLALRKQLYEIVKKTIYSLQAEINYNGQVKAYLDIISDVVNGAAVVTGLVLTLIPGGAIPSAVSTVIGVVDTVGPSLLDCIFEIIVPEGKLNTSKEYISYLQVLAAALEYNSFTSDKEVIKIDSFYEIKSESVPLIVQMNYDIDFTPIVQDSYLFEENLISSFSPLAKFNGTIYPLNNLDDIEKVYSKNPIAIEDVNTGGDIELLLNHSIPNELSQGEYHWYHFVAPETGTYEFKTDSTMDTYGELFSRIVAGKSCDDILAFNDNVNTSPDRNFSLKYDLYKGRKVFLRVRGYDWKSSGLYSLSVRKVSDINPVAEYINDADFGFINEYVENETNKNVNLNSGFSFSTLRYRCGYINNQYLALSAKCKGVTTAYLQLDFEVDINEFNLGIAIWSEEEYLNTKSSIVLETKSFDGVYNVFYKFDISSMSKNKDLLDLYNFVFPERTYGIRIRVDTNQVNYDKNKGRVVLGDMSFITLDR